MKNPKQKLDKQFLKVIRNLQHEIGHEIEAVNCGGCGVFALLFYMAVKDKFPDVKISVTDEASCIDDLKFAASNIARNGNRVPDELRWQFDVDDLAVDHIMVKIGNTHIDGEETMSHSTWMKRHGKNHRGYYTVDELKAALKFGNWNSWYRRTQNKKLQKLIEQHLDCKIKI